MIYENFRQHIVWRPQADLAIDVFPWLVGARVQSWAPETEALACQACQRRAGSSTGRAVTNQHTYHVHSTVHILSGLRHKDVFPQVRDDPKVPATGSSGLVYSTSLALPCLLPKLEILWKNAVRVQRPAHLGQRLPNLETLSQPVLTVEKTSTRARPRPHYLL